MIKRRGWLVFLLAGGLMLAGFLLARVSGTSQLESASTPKLHPIDHTVTLNDLALRLEQLESDQEKKEAEQVYLMMQVTVKNVGTRTTYFSPTVQLKLYDSKGAVLPLAAIAGRDEDSKLEPNEEIKRQVAWRVKPDDQELRLVFAGNLLEKREAGLVNGPITVVVPRQGLGQAVFDLNG